MFSADDRIDSLDAIFLFVVLVVYGVGVEVPLLAGFKNVFLSLINSVLVD